MYTFIHLNVPEMQGGLFAFVVMAGGIICLLTIFAFLSAAYRVARQRLRMSRRRTPSRTTRQPVTPQIPLQRAA